MKTPPSYVSALAREVWAMEPARLEAFLQRLSSIDLMADGPSTGQFARTEMPSAPPDPAGDSREREPRAGLFDEAEPRSRMEVSNGVATIPVTGILMKSVPKIFRWFGIDATSYREIQDALAQAVGDSSVHSIRLAVDSPGGQVAGVKETADALASAPKPVSAQIDDLGASAAYWLASQAKEISALPNALVGSIGVYTSYVDSSKMAEDIGIKVHVVSSGPHKGMGVPGAKITPEQLQATQEVIDGIAANFVADVARGRRRKSEDVQEWATGRLWLARDAKALGLIDQVTMENKKRSAGGRPAAESKPESTEETMDPKELEAAKAKAAEERLAVERKRVTDIKAAFPEDPAFALTQIEAGATLVEAKAAYSDLLVARAEAARKPKPSTGTNAVETGGKPGSDLPVKDFRALAVEEQREHVTVCLERLSAKGGVQPECCTLTAAMSRVSAEQPELHKKYVAAGAERAGARKEALGWRK